MNLDFIAVVVGVLGTQTVVIKWLMARSDNLIDRLGSAVDAFQAFERTESLMHEKLLDGLRTLATTQQEIVKKLLDGGRNADELESDGK